MQSVVYVQKCRDRNVPRPKNPVPNLDMHKILINTYVFGTLE